ncbi:MAG: TRAP transporter substrate-binding protein [Chitinophagales bacterium]
MSKLDRKDFLKKTALAAVTIPAMITACSSESNGNSKEEGGSVQSGKKYKWKMVTTWPPNFPILGEGAEMFAEWVEQMSNGRLSIKVYGGGELVPALEAFDAVSSGTVEMSSGAAYYWAGKVPAAQFFASVPFGMNAQQMNAWMISGGGMELWREVYADFNVIPMLGGNTGVQMGGWFNREINSVADLKGLKMRIPGLGGKVLEKAGGAAVLSAGSELYTNLERGVIDATEWIGPFHDYRMGFHKIAKYYYTPGWHELGSVLELGINKQSFEQLPKDLQVILETASMRLNLWTLAEIETKNAEYLEKIKAEGKIEIREFPDEVLAQLRVYTEEVIAELVASDPVAKKVYDSFEGFRKQIKAWSALTEKVYYDKIEV